MAEPPPSSRPPAEPKPARIPVDATGAIATLERPARWQTVVMVGLGIVLVGVPLYLWRRPRSAAPAVGREDALDAAAAVAAPDLPAPQDAALPAVALGDARVLECHDPGTKHTPPEQCDHIAAFEKSFAQVILDAHDCMPPNSGGTITYVADLAFTHRRSLTIAAPRDGRSVKNPKAVLACVAEVRHGVSALVIDGYTHAHARYKVAMTATYPSSK
jgi:hypothetical protein